MFFTFTTLLLIEAPVFFTNWKILDVVGLLRVGCGLLFLCALGVEILDREMLGLSDLELLVLRFVTDRLF